MPCALLATTNVPDTSFFTMLLSMLSFVYVSVPTSAARKTTWHDCHAAFDETSVMSSQAKLMRLP